MAPQHIHVVRYNIFKKQVQLFVTRQNLPSNAYLKLSLFQLILDINTLHM